MQNIHAKCIHCGVPLDVDALDAYGSPECDDGLGVHDYDTLDPMGELQ